MFYRSNDLLQCILSCVAASADITPDIGVVLKVGKILGRVVRRFPEGFAIEFLTIQDLRTIEGLFKART